MIYVCIPIASVFPSTGGSIRSKLSFRGGRPTPEGGNYRGAAFSNPGRICLGMGGGGQWRR